MRNYKLHIISILIIVLMLIFSLGTSYSVSTDVEVINNSLKNIKLRITRSEPYSSNEYIEEFILLMNQSMRLKTYRTGNHRPTPDEYITSIIIYDENDEIIKNFYKLDDSESFNILFSNLENKGGRNQRYFIFEITDELLK